MIIERYFRQYYLIDTNAFEIHILTTGTNFDRSIFSGYTSMLILYIIMINLLHPKIVLIERLITHVIRYTERN